MKFTLWSEVGPVFYFALAVPSLLVSVGVMGVAFKLIIMGGYLPGILLCAPGLLAAVFSVKLFGAGARARRSKARDVLPRKD